MTQSLKLGGDGAQNAPKIRRVNRLPVIVAIALVITFFAVIFYGLSSRGPRFGADTRIDTSSAPPASNDAERLKQGVPDGIIGEPKPVPAPAAPAAGRTEPATNPFTDPDPVMKPAQTPQQTAPEPQAVWRARLQREFDEQAMREYNRQRMARLQAEDAAANSPIGVDLRSLQAANASTTPDMPQPGVTPNRPASAPDLYDAVLQARASGHNGDPNGQAGKRQFFNRDIAEPGYLPNSVVPQVSPFELKRGSVIPATLVTGINSDLPGRITAQVSQNVYDSATGYRLLIPQGTKLFGRYDSDVSFGQDRVLVVWTDIIFPNGSTLQIGAMAGTDAAGHGGFSDKVDKHHLRTFGSAILVALIGAGTDMLLPQDRSGTGSTDNAQDAARRSFAETFGQLSQQTVSKNLDVQPTLRIRPGYRFNVLVDQDIMFPTAYP